MDQVQALMVRFPRPGRLEWIGVRAERRGPVRVVPEAIAKAGLGLAGDHYRAGVKGIGVSAHARRVTSDKAAE